MYVRLRSFGYTRVYPQWVWCRGRSQVLPHVCNRREPGWCHCGELSGHQSPDLWWPSLLTFSWEGEEHRAQDFHFYPHSALPRFPWASPEILSISGPSHTLFFLTSSRPLFWKVFAATFTLNFQIFLWVLLFLENVLSQGVLFSRLIFNVHGFPIKMPKLSISPTEKCLSNFLGFPHQIGTLFLHLDSNEPESVTIHCMSHQHHKGGPLDRHLMSASSLSLARPSGFLLRAQNAHKRDEYVQAQESARSNYQWQMNIQHPNCNMTDDNCSLHSYSQQMATNTKFCKIGTIQHSLKHSYWKPHRFWV